MMDFDNILDIASQNQGVSSVQRRYSLQAGPSKKDPKSKGVNPAAVQALLNKRHNDTKQKGGRFFSVSRTPPISALLLCLVFFWSLFLHIFQILPKYGFGQLVSQCN
ncbi:hypothetical protein ILYODFUR_023417 [Ilyodon furcidens]|uniref:SPT2 homolog N-terminal domain-containing protein n=1 Tax=Ilyodon furcidens TaxID=33524 RepID=A0ABV0UMI3_9TELE